GSSGCSAACFCSWVILRDLAALLLPTSATAMLSATTTAPSPSTNCGFAQVLRGVSCQGSGLPLASSSRSPALTRSGRPSSSRTSGLSRQKRSKSVAPFSGSRPERYRSTIWFLAMKSLSIAGLAPDDAAALAIETVATLTIVEGGADVDVAEPLGTVPAEGAPAGTVPNPEGLSVLAAETGGDCAAPDTTGGVATTGTAIAPVVSAATGAPTCGVVGDATAGVTGRGSPTSSRGRSARRLSAATAAGIDLGGAGD